MSGQEKIAFLLLLVGLFLLCLVGMGIQPYLMPYMKSIGYTTAFAAGVVSGILTINTAAKIISGYVFDRVGTIGAAGITAGTMIVSLLLLVLLKGSPVVYLFAVIFRLPMWRFRFRHPILPGSCLARTTLQNCTALL